MPGFPNGSSPEVERAIREMAAAQQQGQVAMQIATPINDGQMLALIAAALYRPGESRSIREVLDIASSLYVQASARSATGQLKREADAAIAAERPFLDEQEIR